MARPAAARGWPPLEESEGRARGRAAAEAGPKRGPGPAARPQPLLRRAAGPRAAVPGPQAELRWAGEPAPLPRGLRRHPWRRAGLPPRAGEGLPQVPAPLSQESTPSGRGGWAAPSAAPAARRLPRCPAQPGRHWRRCAPRPAPEGRERRWRGCPARWPRCPTRSGAPAGPGRPGSCCAGRASRWLAASPAVPAGAGERWCARRGAAVRPAPGLRAGSAAGAVQGRAVVRPALYKAKGAGPLPPSKAAPRLAHAAQLPARSCKQRGSLPARQGPSGCSPARGSLELTSPCTSMSSSSTPCASRHCPPAASSSREWCGMDAAVMYGRPGAKGAAAAATAGGPAGEAGGSWAGPAPSVEGLPAPLPPPLPELLPAPAMAAGAALLWPGWWAVAGRGARCRCDKVIPFRYVCMAEAACSPLTTRSCDPAARRCSTAAADGAH